MIIDFHAHTFPDSISEKVIHKLGKLANTFPYTNGSIAGLIESAHAADIQYCINLPVATDANQTSSINDKLIPDAEHLFSQGIITFGAMHPDYADYKKELKRLKDAGIKGIKLHPAYQGVDFNDIRFLRIVEWATELGLVTLIHAGIDIGLYDHNYASVSQIEDVINQVQPDKLVLAHMGGWAAWDDVERDLAGAPVYLDASFSIGPMKTYPDGSVHPYNGIELPDEQFLRILRKHGAGKVLFATDSPWSDQSLYVERFQNIGMTKEEQALFFGENACRLLNLS